jgi:hypothetical protein
MTFSNGLLAAQKPIDRFKVNVVPDRSAARARSIFIVKADEQDVPPYSHRLCRKDLKMDQYYLGTVLRHAPGQ